jgi:RNA polymerase sigma-70 factor, ECF subfamily
MDPLIERAQAGDPRALEALLSQVAPALHRFGMRMCRNESDADDILQDTLLAIAQNLRSYEGRASFSSWAFTLARTSCARKRRGLKNRPPVEHDHADDPDLRALSPEQGAEQEELSRALTDALASLSDEHREVLVLRDMEGLTAPEAATALGISVDALKSRLHRARVALRGALKPVLEREEIPRGATCPDVLALWSQKLEGDLAPADCAAMEAHVQTCPACSAQCDALKRALWACQRSADDTVRPEVQEQVKAALRALGLRPPVLSGV